MLTGMDCFHGDDIASFAPYEFVYIKASQGIGDQDPAHEKRRAELEADGKVHGSYHYFEPGDNVQNQMENFARVVVSIGPNELPPALDLDDFRGFDPQVYLALALEAAIWIQRNLRRRPIIYGNYDMLSQFAGSNSIDISAFPLWIASYRDQPQIPNQWGTWTFWQYQEDPFDGDRFNGDASDLQRLIQDSKL